MEDFNRKLYCWLSDQQVFINEVISQEELFDMCVGNKDILEEKLLMHHKTVVKIIEEYTRLSFIVKNHPKKLDKLLDYLEI